MNRRDFIRTLGIIPFGFSVQWDKMGKEINGLSSSVKRKHKLPNSYAREIETFHILKSQWEVIWEGSHYALWKFIKDEFGYEIPQSSVCEGHVAPMHFLADVFFMDDDLKDIVLVRGNRQGGMTFLLTMLSHLNSLFKPNFSTLYGGGFGLWHEALRAYDYLCDLLKSSISQRHLIYSARRETRYTNGSSIQIHSPARDVGIAVQPTNCAILDGVEFTPTNRLREFLTVSETRNGYRPTCILATAEERHEDFLSGSTFTWCVFETVQRCVLPSCDQCKEIVRVDKTGKKLESWYDICHEDIQRHPYGKCRAASGFMPLDDVWNKFMYLDWDIFDKMYRCL